MQKNYTAKRERKRQLCTTSRHITENCRCRRSLSFVKKVPINEHFLISLNDKLKCISCDKIFDRPYNRIICLQRKYVKKLERVRSSLLYL